MSQGSEEGAAESPAGVAREEEGVAGEEEGVADEEEGARRTPASGEADAPVSALSLLRRRMASAQLR